MLKMKSISVIDTSARAQGHPIAGPLELVQSLTEPHLSHGERPVRQSWESASLSESGQGTQPLSASASCSGRWGHRCNFSEDPVR